MVHSGTLRWKLTDHQKCLITLIFTIWNNEIILIHSSFWRNKTFNLWFGLHIHPSKWLHTPSASRTICCVCIRTDGGCSGPSLVLSMCLRSGTGRPDTADTASWLSRTHGTMPLTLLHIRQHSHTSSSSIFSRQAWGKSVEDHLSNQTIFHCIALFHCVQPLYCEAQARVRQGSARDGSQGKRPQSLNPCLELTLKLVATHHHQLTD